MALAAISAWPHPHWLGRTCVKSCGRDPLVMDPSGHGPLGLGGALQRRMRLRPLGPRASPAEAGLIGARLGAQSRGRNDQAPLMRFWSLQRSLAREALSWACHHPGRSRFSVLPALAFTVAGLAHAVFRWAACLCVLRSLSSWHRQINWVCREMPMDLSLTCEAAVVEPRVIRPALLWICIRATFRARGCDCSPPGRMGHIHRWPHPATLMGFGVSFAVLLQRREYTDDRPIQPTCRCLVRLARVF